MPTSELPAGTEGTSDGYERGGNRNVRLSSTIWITSESTRRDLAGSVRLPLECVHAYPLGYSQAVFPPVIGARG